MTLRIPLTALHRCLARFGQPKLVLHLVNEGLDMLDLRLIASRTDEDSAPLHIVLKPGEKQLYPFHLPCGADGLRVEGDSPALRASLSLAAADLLAAALAPASLMQGLTAHMRTIDGLGQDLFYARAFDAPFERADWQARHQGAPDPGPPFAALDTDLAPLPANKPLVSIVVPTRNGLNLMHGLLASLKLTAYAPYELIIVDNGSDDPDVLALFEQLTSTGLAKILRDDGDFNFSRLMNRGFAELSLNNDIEIIDPHWLDELVQVASIPGTGMAAPLLLYPDGRVQHAGMILGVAQACEHVFRFADPRDLPPTRRKASALTGACLLITRTAWEKAGPFDEDVFPIGFNDIDLCLKVRQAGFAAIFTGHTRLIHHESVSRGHDMDPARRARALDEASRFQARWGEDLARDPFLSPAYSAAVWPRLRG
jgi:GT2 family glycosyltransferase